VSGPGGVTGSEPRGAGGLAPWSSGTASETPICSAKGCQQPAAWDLLWNNPKLHTPERRKVWLACEGHRASLSDFLAARGFLKDVEPHDPDREG
jgi:hypothetical protein